MRVRQHGHGREVVRLRGEARDDAVQRGQHDFVARVLEHQRVAQIVDVFGSAGEVDELGDFNYFSIAGQPLFQKILDGFDIVIGGGFDGFYRSAVGF